jgi:SAM-dependent methyltransferase
MTELDKYKGIYTSGKLPKYGHTNHGARAMGLVEKWKPTSIVDVGCGWNEFAKIARQKLPESRIVGVDFACPGADVVAPATKLPFSNKEFDLLTSFDMLEHLTPDEVDKALASMARVSQRFIVSISYEPSVNKWQGSTLHPTVRDEEWWITRLMRAGALAITKHGRYIYGRWHSPLLIKPDANVVLVGNGPGVLQRKLGPVIDTFDEVIRFNNYHIEGFESHVGTRTTLWSSFFRRIDPKQKHHRVICPHENDKPADYCTEVYFLPSWFYNRTRSHVQKRAFWASGFQRDVEPLLATSGMLLTCFLLEVVGVQKLHLVGFDHFSKALTGQHHYWIPSAFKRPPEHDGDLEEAIFADLRKAGKVTYL